MRTVSFYRIAVIVFMATRFFWELYWFQKRHRQPWTKETEQRWESLVGRQAAEYRQKAVLLQGLLIKFGQFLSTRADLMPPSFLRELESLIDQVPPVPWEQVRAVLDEEWGEYGEVLHRISVEPVASASIGVVYKGFLHDGTCVAVKVRRPRIDRIIYADFRALRIVMWLARRFTKWGRKADLPALYRQMVAVISDELDFTKELQNGLYFRDHYVGWDGIYIPRFHPEHSTRRVLVMEWVEGVRITDISFIQENGLDRHELAARLVRAFADQLFSGGRFHADPHPGNILLKADGTIVLIDFGMIGTIRDDDARHIRSLVEGIVFEDVDKILDSLENLRFLLPDADRRLLQDAVLLVIRLYRSQGLPRFDDEALERLLRDIQVLIREQPIQLPSEFAFLGRALSTLVGVLHALDPGVDLAELGRPIVEGWVREHDQTSALGPARLWKLAREYAGPLVRYPRLIEDILEAPSRRLAAEAQARRTDREIAFFGRLTAYAYLVFLLSGVTIFAGLYAHRPGLAADAGGAAVVSLLCGIVWSLAQYRRVARK